MPVLEIDAMVEAKKIHEYLSTDDMIKISNRNLIIHLKNGNDLNFQSTLVQFGRSNGEICQAELSVPINFNGEIRMWTEDFKGKKVWSTMDKISSHQCNKFILFDFLGKYTHRYTSDEFSDLPF